MDFTEVASDLAEKIRSLQWKSLTGQELAQNIDGLGLTDPESGFCRVVGTDNLGRVKCEDCPLSNGDPAGCMNLIQKARNSALSKKVKRSKLYLEELAQVLDNVIRNEGSELQDQ